jgi:two-component system OmpR family response regulator
MNFYGAGLGMPIRAAMHMTQKKQVLLVEDDPHIAEIVRLHLVDEGFEVTHAADGQVALQALGQMPWDAVILDLMLPKFDGLEVCRYARALDGYTPIIMISARSSEVHRILGLELGADDYLPKPFSVMELVARLRALMRRVEAMGRQTRSDGARLVVGDLAIDALTRDARLRSQRLDLTPREFDLLHFFVKNPGKVFSRLDLLNKVWGYEHDGYEHTVNTHINRLRAKVEQDPASPKRILTVWGVGYKLAAQAS